MVGGKKQLVSVRLCQSDVERIQALAARMRVRESDIIRFALRLAFGRLAPLLNEQARGRDLIPIFLECGPELTYHFDLEPRTLEAIVNDGLDDPEKKVDSHDIELIAALHLPGYRLPFTPDSAANVLSPPGGLQQYLYNKYVHPAAARNNRVHMENPVALDEGATS